MDPTDTNKWTDIETHVDGLLARLQDPDSPGHYTLRLCLYPAGMLSLVLARAAGVHNPKQTRTAQCGSVHYAPHIARRRVTITPNPTIVPVARAVRWSTYYS